MAEVFLFQISQYRREAFEVAKGLSEPAWIVCVFV